MSAADQEHWDHRFSQITAVPRVVNVLTDNEHLLPKQGAALDLACGLGGNALWLAERGVSVEAWDCSSLALAKLRNAAKDKGLDITTRHTDLEETPLPRAAFDLIVVSGFLSRSLCPTIVEALRPGGLLAYQTYTQFKPAEGLHSPRNKDYLLAPGELLNLFDGLKPCVYREEGGYGDLQQGLRNQAYLLACLGD